METGGITTKSPKKLFVVDGHAYAYRAFYAIRQLSSPEGNPTNAIYGFIRMLNKMRADLEPTHIMVVWDGGLAKQRVALLPEYKTHRPAMPPSLEVQLDEILNFLQASRIASYMREGIEADDWIATLATRAVVEGFSVVIASADKDFLQLVSDNVGLLNPNDKMAKIWTAKDVRAKTGVEPSQIVDWLSLIGDKVDNIPGVPGIGPLRAAELLGKFRSIDNLYLNLEYVPSERLRLALQTAESDVRRNLELIKLHTDMPDGISWESLVPGVSDKARLLAFYERCGFKTLAREIQETIQEQGSLL